jgi:hypothetical protein
MSMLYNPINPFVDMGFSDFHIIPSYWACYFMFESVPLVMTRLYHKPIDSPSFLM